MKINIGVIEMNKEVFKQVLGYNNYLVSNYGRVYSKSRKKILVQAVDKYGYHYVNLSQNGDYKAVKVHRIVVEAFLGRKLLPTEDIHHLVSKDDNCFDHMIVLPHSEHLKLHKFGTHHTEQTKQKIRTKMKQYWENIKKEKEGEE